MAAAARNAAKSADHTLYHLAPQGFWKKFRDVVAVNSEISSGVPIVVLHRYPQPGSRPELYSTPATKASDPAQNPYWKRDVRRNYPRLSVVTQAQLSKFLLQSPNLQAVAPSTSASAADASEPTSVATAPTSKDLTQALEILSAAGKSAFTDASHIPTPVSSYKKWIPEYTEDAPHDPNSYFPMSLVK
ncbi:21 kDa subunit of NADH dehydrogenase [Ramaria rubella]|nr:21 kDa subunit of NADH dehydrogenase [Ramaria rubella]